MHRHREIQSLQMHRKVAAMMEHDPDAVICKALCHLHAWIERQQDSPPGVFLEWLNLLAHRTPRQIADFIVSDSEEAARLRQSSPFAGVLSPQEVWAIKRSHARDVPAC
jgi:hypothetical protein